MQISKGRRSGFRLNTVLRTYTSCEVLKDSEANTFVHLSKSASVLNTRTGSADHVFLTLQDVGFLS